MAAIVERREADSHRVLADVKPVMAKATVRLSEVRNFQAEIGACLNAARNALGWNLDELAHALGKDARQVRRWISGEERTQVDVCFACDAIRAEFGIRLAALSGAEIETVVRIKRTA
jgi:ribosome-binding protein aMBF1 (putative translation factor)